MALEIAVYSLGLCNPPGHPLLYEQVTLSALSDHSLRLQSPALCGPHTKQYSGYLDVTNRKHLFFWWVTTTLELSFMRFYTFRIAENLTDSVSASSMKLTRTPRRHLLYVFADIDNILTILTMNPYTITSTRAVPRSTRHLDNTYIKYTLVIGLSPKK